MYRDLFMKAMSNYKMLPNLNADHQFIKYYIYIKLTSKKRNVFFFQSFRYYTSVQRY